MSFAATSNSVRLDLWLCPKDERLSYPFSRSRQVYLLLLHQKQCIFTHSLRVREFIYPHQLIKAFVLQEGTIQGSSTALTWSPAASVHLRYACGTERVLCLVTCAASNFSYKHLMEACGIQNVSQCELSLCLALPAILNLNVGPHLALKNLFNFS